MVGTWRGLVEPLCSNIHAWPGTAGGRLSRRVGGHVWLPAIPTLRRKSAVAAGSLSARNGLAIDRQRPSVGRTDGRPVVGHLAGPSGTRAQRGRTN